MTAGEEVGGAGVGEQGEGLLTSVPHPTHLHYCPYNNSAQERSITKYAVTTGGSMEMDLI